MSDPTRRADSRLVQLPLASAGLAGRGPIPAVGTVKDACSDSAQTMLSTLLTIERLCITLYYTALTTRAVISHTYLAGATADPNQVASNGNRVNVANLQAALDQEQKHAAMLETRGGSSRYSQFFFPAPSFAGLGYTTIPGSFLWVLDHLETFAISAYLAAVRRFGVLGGADLAQLAARLAGTESQHRVLGRVIAGETPANNVALEVTSFTCVSGVGNSLRPYLTGEGFPMGATRAIGLPPAGKIARAIGKHHSQ